LGIDEFLQSFSGRDTPTALETHRFLLKFCSRQQLGLIIASCWKIGLKWPLLVGEVMDIIAKKNK
jgi:hypothetical protein